MKVKIYYVSLEQGRKGEIIKEKDPDFSEYEERNLPCYVVKNHLFAREVARLIKEGELKKALDLANESIEIYSHRR